MALVDENPFVEGAQRHPCLGRQTLLRAHRAVVAQHYRPRLEQCGERLDDERLDPGAAGGVRLQNENLIITIDD